MITTTTTSSTQRRGQIKIPQPQIKAHATAAAAHPAPAPPRIVRHGIDAADNERVAAGRKVHAAQHVPLVHFLQACGGRRRIVVVVVGIGSVAATAITVAATTVVVHAPKVQARPVGNRQDPSGGMKGQTDNGKFEAHHLQTDLVAPVPDPYLVSQTSRRHDVGIVRVVLDRPRGARVSLERL